MTHGRAAPKEPQAAISARREPLEAGWRAQFGSPVKAKRAPSRRRRFFFWLLKKNSSHRGDQKKQNTSWLLARSARSFALLFSRTSKDVTK